ncbi:WD40-repeat-containing domain protein [Syncephalis fuscata]|nr:WD40-repeat-containing domain protein [Syncephalis fuscata]
MTAESSPFFILRGHEAQITSLAFNKENSQLYSGDVDGDVVVWDLRSRRPLRHMHVHTGGVLCVASLGVDYLFTHGRDRRACIWRLIDEITAKEAIATGRRTAPPQLIRQVAVNDTNFCKASLLCLAPSSTADTTLPLCIMAAPAVSHHDKIDVYCLKTEQKLCTIGEIEAKTGVCMALSLLNKQQQAFTSDASASSLLQYSYLLAGYEDGSVIAWMWSDTAESTISQMAWRVSVYKEPSK